MCSGLGLPARLEPEALTGTTSLQRSLLPSLSWAFPKLAHPKPRTPEPSVPEAWCAHGVVPCGTATHLSGVGGSGCTPPPHSLGRWCRATVQGRDRAGSRQLGLRRRCHRNQASSAHRTGPRCGGHTGRSLRVETRTAVHHLSPGHPRNCAHPSGSSHRAPRVELGRAPSEAEVAWPGAGPPGFRSSVYWPVNPAVISQAVSQCPRLQHGNSRGAGLEVSHQTGESRRPRWPRHTCCHY